MCKLSKFSILFLLSIFFASKLTAQWVQTNGSNGGTSAANVALRNSQNVGQSDRMIGPLADTTFQKITRGPVSLHESMEQNLSTLSPILRVAEIDSFIRNHMQVNRIPGLAACVVKGGIIAWEGYYGLANIAQQESVRHNTIFMLASISKTVTATALMELWERGRFGLDDSINAYLPFPVRNPSFPGVPITFRQLLCHVSSINDTWSLMPYFVGDPPLALGWYMQEYLTPGGSYFSTTNYAESPPAAQFAYCNIAAALAGYLVETITGIPFDRYCRDSLFVPLGMSNTAWFLRDLDTTLIARPYWWNGSYHDIGLYGYPDYPDGQLRTTARSLGRFLAAYIDFGVVDGIRILDSTTVQLMRSIQYPALNLSQGLIWYRSVVGGRTRWGHSGGDRGVQTFMYLDETQRYGAIVLTNFSPPSSTLPVVAALLAMAETLTVNPGTVTNHYAVNNGWNMASLPLTVSDPRKTVVYPTANSSAFAFDQTAGYVVRDTLNYGEGYWLKFPSPQNIPLTGYPILRDTINVTGGWNLMGSISQPVQVSAVLPIGTFIQSPFYGFTLTGYTPADTLVPGLGYWVKVNQDGQLVIGSPAVFNLMSKTR